MASMLHPLVQVLTSTRVTKELIVHIKWIGPKEGKRRLAENVCPIDDLNVAFSSLSPNDIKPRDYGAYFPYKINWVKG